MRRDSVEQKERVIADDDEAAARAEQPRNFLVQRHKIGKMFIGERAVDKGLRAALLGQPSTVQ